MGNGRSKKCARRNSLYIPPLAPEEQHCPFSPTGWENNFCFLVLSNFLPVSSCHRGHLWVQEEILAKELMLIKWFQHLLRRARGQPLCFCNSGAARRGRWRTEKLIGKGEGEGEKAEAAAENWPFLNTRFSFLSVPSLCFDLHYELCLVLTISYLMKGRELTGLLAECLFNFRLDKKLVGK